MFGIGVPELVVILVVALFIFGPGKLPEIGSALGKGIRDFKRAFDGKDEIEAPKKSDAGGGTGQSA
ncbi:MAG: twin-arginine translocase TatA/TatE family subunit [Deltaproteobacteria bacterium]|nr:twin-arginine translocase TatA/TatE family subunit [Deltaproteobacteria bacterium]